MKNEIKKIGRPTDYTTELGNEICDVIACSSKGLAPLCKENKHWPNPDTVYSWRNKHKEFAEKYAIAKQRQIEVIVDEILVIADDASKDTVIKVDDDGNEKAFCNAEWINRSRLRIDTRKWLAAKLVPRLYGNKDEYINLKVPDGLSSSEGLVVMSETVFKALASQEITPEQARLLVSTIKDHGTNVVMSDLAKRLLELERNKHA